MGKGLVVVIFSGELTARLTARFVEKLLASVTCTVKLAVPAAVGVPLRTPPLLKLNPAGKLPDASDQLYGVVPPVAAKV